MLDGSYFKESHHDESDSTKPYSNYDYPDSHVNSTPPMGATEESLEVVLKKEIPKPPPPPVDDFDDSVGGEDLHDVDFDRSDRDLEEFEEHPDDNKKRNLRKYCIIFLCIAVVISIITPISVIQPWKKDNDSQASDRLSEEKTIAENVTVDDDADKNLNIPTVNLTEPTRSPTIGTITLPPVSTPPVSTPPVSTEIIQTPGPTSSISPSLVKSMAPSASQSPSVSASPTDITMQMISRLERLSPNALLDDSSSPQGQAVARLLDDGDIDSPDEVLVQKYSLLTLFYATNGTTWQDSTGWDGNSNTDVCQWSGVTCDTQVNGRKLQTDIFESVVQLELSFNGMEGQLPGELCSLSRVTTLTLGNNNLNGNIPECISDLSQLSILDLATNSISGRIPESLYDISSLVTLSLAENKLEGSISPSIAQLQNLEWLEIGLNELTGEIPSEIGNLNALRRVVANNNLLIGSVPSEFFIGQSITIVDFGFNQLDGSLPAEMGGSSNLRVFNGNNNNFTGTIPSEIGNLGRSLRVLNLSTNNLGGSLPTEFGLLTAMRRFRLDNNEFQGNLPTELTGMTNIDVLRLEQNEFSGEVPFAFCRINDLELTADCAGSLPGLFCSCCDECF